MSIINRTVTLLLAAMLLVSLFAGTAALAETEAPMLCRYVVPGSETDDSAMVDQAISDKLKADGINMDFSRIYVPWDVWQQKVSLMLTAGEEFELVHIMEDWIPSSTYVAQNALAPLNDWIDQYGGKLKEIIPEKAWSNAAINGQIYSIPVYFRDFSKMISNYYLPVHLMNKHGIEMPTDAYGVIDVYEKIIQAENDPELRWWIKVNAVSDYPWLREYDSYPFVTIESMFYIDQQGVVKPWLETEEFKWFCEYLRTAYEKGVIHPDILTYPSERVSQLTEQGKNLGSDLYSLETMRKTIPEHDIALFAPAQEKPFFCGEWIFMNANAVSATSPNPEAGVIFFNWVYSSQENYDLLNYGIKGVHWNEEGDRLFSYIYNEDGTAPYTFGDWEIGHKDLVRMVNTAPPELAVIALEMDPAADVSVASGFKFDSEKVASEYANCSAQLQSVIYPIKYGVVSYEDGYEAAMQAMRAAGYDAVVAEFKAQFDAWYSAR